MNNLLDIFRRSECLLRIKNSRRLGFSDCLYRGYSYMVNISEQILADKNIVPGRHFGVKLQVDNISKNSMMV